jgi:hypothetical protein
VLPTAGCCTELTVRARAAVRATREGDRVRRRARAQPQYSVTQHLVGLRRDADGEALDKVVEGRGEEQQLDLRAGERPCHALRGPWLRNMHSNSGQWGREGMDKVHPLLGRAGELTRDVRPSSKARARVRRGQGQASG